MNKYKVGIFSADGEGVFKGMGGVLQDWLEEGVLEGYRMVGPALPVANVTGIYILVTMELDDDSDDDDETPSGFYEPIR